jgi:hypothetical protein
MRSEFTTPRCIQVDRDPAVEGDRLEPCFFFGGLSQTAKDRTFAEVLEVWDISRQGTMLTYVTLTARKRVMHGENCTISWRPSAIEEEFVRGRRSMLGRPLLGRKPTRRETCAAILVGSCRIWRQRENTRRRVVAAAWCRDRHAAVRQLVRGVFRCRRKHVDLAHRLVPDQQHACRTRGEPQATHGADRRAQRSRPSSAISMESLRR